ncbi:ABC transporter substrate-binding protein [Actinomadura decatromicini]|uniref:ABC transporter substrate-binding protein n=1 Tax=Actinomadura decatromicini TaxID=2604572 RepID=A0A5D3FDP3_9ACTN|nr:ABC transporter substrate-binding protein [Actinomadura decatromicini]TYK46074.1 ABC transporter substrate-binding protein [Actinomadura decatromicini]
MTTRSLRGGAAALSLGLLLSGCGGSSGSPAGAGGRGTITVATGKDLTRTVPKLVDAWNRAHPKERVRLVELPEDGDQARRQLVQNMRIKSHAYDVVRLDAVWTAEFAAHRWIPPLPDGLLDTASLVPAALATGRYRGRLYAAPWLTGTGVLYYRKDLLAGAGIPNPPTTWDELRAACARVQRKAKGVDCYAGQFSEYEGLTVNYAEAVQSAGGEVFDSSGRPQVTTPEAKAGLRFLVDGFENGTIPKKALTFKEEEGRRAFQEGHLVFHRNWAYVYALASADSRVAGRFGVAPVPGEDGPGSGTLGGDNLAVSAFSEHQATARDFIAYIVSAPVQRQYARAQSFPLSLAALYHDPEMVKLYPYLPTLRQGMEKAKPRPVVVRYNEVSTAVQKHVTDAITGKRTVDQASAELQHALSALTR